MSVIEYTDAEGRNQYRRSFRRLDDRSQARIIAGIARIEQGNFSDSRYLGSGIWERRFLGRGPGVRLYYSRIGEDVTLLLVAGDKSSAREQQADIGQARGYLSDWTARAR